MTDDLDIEPEPTERAGHTVTVDAPPEEVWSIVTENDELSTWLGDDAELDPVPGGQGQVVDDDGVLRHIRVEGVEEGQSIRWTWWPDADEDDVSTVEITMVPVEEGTEVRVVETAPVASAAASARWAERALSLELEVLLRGELVPSRPAIIAMAPP